MTVMYQSYARARMFAAVTASALLMSAIAAPAAAESVRWRTVVGILQAGNLVGNITGGGQPWTTLGGHASARFVHWSSGVDLRGLVLGGGNAIGNADGINQVKGTLVCDAGGLNLAFDTVLVPLSARGDAEFAGVVGPIPTTCSHRNVGSDPTLLVCTS